MKDQPKTTPDDLLAECDFAEKDFESELQRFVDALRAAIKERDEARAELAELNEWDIHALKERDDLREKLAIAVEALTRIDKLCREAKIGEVK